MTVQQSKRVAYILPCVIKTVVLTYNINIIIRIQALCGAFIQKLCCYVLFHVHRV